MIMNTRSANDLLSKEENNKKNNIAKANDDDNDDEDEDDDDNEKAKNKKTIKKKKMMIKNSNNTKTALIGCCSYSAASSSFSFSCLSSRSASSLIQAKINNLSKSVENTISGNSKANKSESNQRAIRRLCHINQAAAFIQERSTSPLSSNSSSSNQLLTAKPKEAKSASKNSLSAASSLLAVNQTTHLTKSTKANRIKSNKASNSTSTSTASVASNDSNRAQAQSNLFAKSNSAYNLVEARASLSHLSKYQQLPVRPHSKSLQDDTSIKLNKQEVPTIRTNFVDDRKASKELDEQVEEEPDDLLESSSNEDNDNYDNYDNYDDDDATNFYSRHARRNKCLESSSTSSLRSSRLDAHRLDLFNKQLKSSSFVSSPLAKCKISSSINNRSVSSSDAIKTTNYKFTTLTKSKQKAITKSSSATMLNGNSNEKTNTTDQSNNNTSTIECDHQKTKHELATGYGFNEDQIGIFEETFQIFDKDCDGFITLVEIRTVMNALGFFPGDDAIRKSIKVIDNDNSGTVDFEEFISMMSRFRKVKTSIELEDELKEIFNIFDRNNDGFIDKAELKDVLVKLGENITDDEVAEMIKEADLDGDNKVSYSEFKSILYDNKHR